MSVFDKVSSSYGLGKTWSTGYGFTQFLSIVIPFKTSLLIEMHAAEGKGSNADVDIVKYSAF